MARTFKISFPLPGRRPSSSPHSTPGSQISSRSEEDGSPSYHPGSKAERILGASDKAFLGQSKKSSKRDKNSLRKLPSFMSVTLADLDEESSKVEDGFPFPGMQTPNEISGPLAPDLSRHGSSPLLGEHVIGKSLNGDNFNPGFSTHIRRAESSATLRSAYDRNQQSRQVSQQMLASSTRESSLRKGMPSPLRQNTAQTPKLGESSKIHVRNVSAESKISAGSKASTAAKMKIDGTPRRRPSINDHPTLYPNAPRTFHAVSPPPALMGASLPKPSASLDPKESSGSKYKWWQRSRTPSAPPEVSEDGSDPNKCQEECSMVKVNVRKPKAGARYWFDGIDDDDPSLGHFSPQPDVQTPQSEHLPGPSSIHEIMSQNLRPSFISQRTSSFSSRNKHFIPTDHVMNSRMETNGPQKRPYYSSPSFSGSTPTSPGSKSVKSTETSRGIHGGMDLLSESVLSLSSSEDDDDGTAHAELPYRARRIRGSIERADYGDEVCLGNVQRIQPAKPRPVVGRQSRRSSSRKSNGMDPVPPVPQIPHGPHLSQRTSSLQWREMMEAQSSTLDAGESTLESGESSLNGNSTVKRTLSSRMRRSKYIRGSKLMKVTSEEERLLEAMREKRASIRQDDYQKGFNNAMRLQQDSVSRPQTAAVDGRSSRSSTYGSRSSSSPPLPGHNYKSSLTEPRRSASTDNLTPEEFSYPFPDVKDSRKLNNDFNASSKPSPSLSFSPSDILPSTPSTRDSPMTPPSTVYSRSSPRSFTMTKPLGHDRKRTISSSVVMLDGVEQHAQQLDEENEITGWAMDSY